MQFCFKTYIHSNVFLIIKSNLTGIIDTHDVSVLVDHRSVQKTRLKI